MVVMKKMKKGQRGFTLIELVAVMAIIAILVLIVIVAISLARKQARRNQLTSDARAIKNALEGYRYATGSYPPTAINYAGNTAFDAYILTNNDYSGTDFGNVKGALVPYLDKPIKRPFDASQGRLCYYGLFTPASGQGYEYLLWFQSEDMISAYTLTYCSSSHGTIQNGTAAKSWKKDTDAIFSLPEKMRP
jgi:prepilin-type N-terminal cleavage/methylation domain-containing protein